MHNDWFYPNGLPKCIALYDTSVSLGIKSKFMTFFVITRDNNGESCEYITLSKFSVKMKRSLVKLMHARMQVWKFGEGKLRRA